MSLKDVLGLSDQQEALVKGRESILRDQHLLAPGQQPELQAALWWALDFGTDEQVKKALAAGASPNLTFPRGDTPLGSVVVNSRRERNRLELVRALLAAGADPAAPSQGEIPLVLAAQYNRPELLGTLWEFTDKTALRKDRLTSLVLAAATIGSAEFVQRAIATGASPNAFGKTSSAADPGCPVTPLMLASFFGYTAVVEVLLEAGADVNLKDEQEHTPLDYARFDAKACREVIALLQKAGGISAKPFRDPRTATRGFASAAKKPEFKRAVARLTELAGAPSSPLEGVDGTIPGGCGFLMPEDDARTLVERHQSEFLENGFYLFFTKDLTEKNGTAVAMLPTADVYRVLAAVETEGANSRVSNEDLIAWLRKLEKKHPFRIMGIGSDFIEGRFTAPIVDAPAIVRQINKLCPDGDEDAETEQRQVEELRRTGRLFLWWD